MLSPFNIKLFGFDKIRLQNPDRKRSKTPRDCLDYCEGYGVVDEIILPNRGGWIQFKGTLWKARCDRALTLTPGDRVIVVGRENHTLLVEPSTFQP